VAARRDRAGEVDALRAALRAIRARSSARLWSARGAAPRAARLDCLRVLGAAA
jgi:hypothetical protein